MNRSQQDEYEAFLQQQILQQQIGTQVQEDDVVDTAGEALVWMNTPAASKTLKKLKKFINKDVILGNLKDKDLQIMHAHFSFAMKLKNQGLDDAAEFILAQMYFRFNASNSRLGFARRLAKSKFTEQSHILEVKNKK